MGSGLSGHVFLEDYFDALPCRARLPFYLLRFQLGKNKGKRD
jgi:hypothetical protein